MIRSTHHHERGVDIATIEGCLVQTDGAPVRNMLLQLVASGSGKLVLNLAGATAVDCHGLATLVIVWKAILERNGRAVLSAIPPDVLALIELTRLQTLFEIYASDSVAIGKLTALHHEAVSDLRVRKPRAGAADPPGDIPYNPLQGRLFTGLSKAQADQAINVP